MTNPLSERCRALGIRLAAEGDRLEIDAPSGALTPDLLDEIRTHKLALLAALANPSGNVTAPTGPGESVHFLDVWLARQDWRRWQFFRGRYVGPETHLTRGSWT